MFIKFLSYHGNHSSQYNTVTQLLIVLEVFLFANWFPIPCFLVTTNAFDTIYDPKRLLRATYMTVRIWAYWWLRNNPLRYYLELRYRWIRSWVYINYWFSLLQEYGFLSYGVDIVWNSKSIVSMITQEFMNMPRQKLRRIISRSLAINFGTMKQYFLFINQQSSCILVT